MVKNIYKKFMQKFLFSLMALIIGFCNYFSFGVVFAASDFNTGASDAPLEVGNATQSTGTFNWGSSLNGVNPGDSLRFNVYYHNASSSNANNTTVTLNLSPSGSSSNFTAQAQIAATGFNTYTSSATIGLNQSQSISLGSTAKWYHNYNGSAYQVDDVNVSVSGNTATVNLGSIAPGYAPNDGYVIFSATVNSSQANNITLAANAGPDQTVYSGNTVYLNGSSSTGNSLTYSWSCSSGVNLSNSNTANPTFIAPGVNSETIYTCALTVTDSNSNSKSDTVNITVKPQTATTTSTNTGVYYTGNINAEMLSPTDNKGTAIALNAKILECTTGSCKARFIWGTNASSLTNTTKWIENLKQGNTFSDTITGLQKGEVYYAGLEVQMGSKTFKIANDQAIKFITIPNQPTSFLAKLKNNTSIELNWLLGEGGDIILIKRGINTCPTALESGSPVVYYGKGQTIVDDGLSPNTSYCYRAWMITYDGSKLIYSDPTEVLISTKSTASATSYTPKTSYTPTQTLASKNEKKEFSLSTSARNTSLGETSYKKNVSAGAGDNIEFSVEVKNTGDSKLENIIVKNLISSELTVKNIFIDNISHSLDSIDNAYIKELEAGKTAKINFTLTMGEYENPGSIMVVTEVSADGLNSMTDTVNVQKNALAIVDDTSETDTMEASLFSTLMAGNLFPWSILALILLVLLIVYFSLKEERRNK